MDAVQQSRAEESVQEFANQATTVEELHELMRLMMKCGLERMLDTEMDVHVGRRPMADSATSGLSPSLAASEKRRSPNRRNGRGRKMVQGDLDAVTLSTPRDWDGVGRDSYGKFAPGQGEFAIELSNGGCGFLRGTRRRGPTDGRSVA